MSAQQPDTRIIEDVAIKKQLADMIDTLKADKLYASEYVQFVSGMSYASEDESVSFEQALDRIITAISDQ